jgi:type IV secretion system protein VirB10
MIYYTQFHSEKQRAVAEREKSTVSTKPQQMAGFFPTDYSGDRSAEPAPAKQPAPPASTTTAPPPAAPIAPAHTIATPPQPPKPMAPMFVNGKDPAIAALAQEEGGNAAGRRLAQQPSLGDYRPGTSDGDGNRLPLDARQGLAAQKAAWLTNAGNAGQDVVTAPFRPPLSKYQIQAGVIIHAALLTAVNTDLPGDVVALITHDVFDTATGQYLLIPSGSKLYGRYDNQLSYGQTRAAIAWNRILFRNGTSQNIGAMVGTDSSGSAGVEADVDRHSGAMAAAIAGSAAFTVLGQVGALFGDGDTNTNIGVAGAEAAGAETANIGRQIVSKELARPNTLTIPQGYQVAVMLSRDMALPPYAQN